MWRFTASARIQPKPIVYHSVPRFRLVAYPGVAMKVRLAVLSAAIAALVSVSTALAAPGAVRLKERGSAQDQQACTPDVFRLCFGSIPNEPAIVSCLKRSMPQLSPGCRSVFSSKPSKSRRAGRTRGKPMRTGSIRRR